MWVINWPWCHWSLSVCIYNLIIIIYSIISHFVCIDWWIWCFFWFHQDPPPTPGFAKWLFENSIWHNLNFDLTLGAIKLYIHIYSQKWVQSSKLSHKSNDICHSHFAKPCCIWVSLIHTPVVISHLNRTGHQHCPQWPTFRDSAS